MTVEASRTLGICDKIFAAPVLMHPRHEQAGETKHMLANLHLYDAEPEN